MRIRTLSFLASAVVLCGCSIFSIARVEAAQGEKAFDYEGQASAPDDVVKIVFIADAGNHGSRGHHEFVAGSIFLARELHAANENVHAVVHSTKNWPTDLSHADAIVILLNHAGRAALNPEVQKAAARGAGIAALHYGVEVNAGVEGDNYLKWIGGYFEKFWSVNPWWVPKFESIPEHPITRGVNPFSVRDEWYYHMRFQAEMENVTPLLSDLPSLKTIKGGGKERQAHGGNPDVWADVSAGKDQTVAWAYERPEGGRGFGFTGLHLHENFATDGFRQILVNAVAWVSGLEIPEGGIESRSITKDDLEVFIDEAEAAVADGR